MNSNRLASVTIKDPIMDLHLVARYFSGSLFYSMCADVCFSLGSSELFLSGLFQVFKSFFLTPKLSQQLQTLSHWSISRQLAQEFVFQQIMGGKKSPLYFPEEMQNKLSWYQDILRPVQTNIVLASGSTWWQTSRDVFETWLNIRMANSNLLESSVCIFAYSNDVLFVRITHLWNE